MPEAMLHIGLARKDHAGVLRPTRAAVLLFAEDPAGLLAGKACIRILHYKGDRVQRAPTPNLLKPPKTVGGPLIRQIGDALEYLKGGAGDWCRDGPFRL